MFANPDVELPRQAGYVGSVLAGILSSIILYVYFTSFLPPLPSQNLQSLLIGEYQEILAITVLVISVSQIIGGASWSKFFLDGVLIFFINHSDHFICISFSIFDYNFFILDKYW